MTVKKTALGMFALIAFLVASRVIPHPPNFGVWLGSDFYPQTAEGLIACYVAALPFFGNTLVSTVAFSGLFYGLMRMAGQQGRITQL